MIQPARRPSSKWQLLSHDAQCNFLSLTRNDDSPMLSMNTCDGFASTMTRFSMMLTWVAHICTKIAITGTELRSRHVTNLSFVSKEKSRRSTKEYLFVCQPMNMDHFYAFISPFCYMMAYLRLVCANRYYIGML